MYPPDPQPLVALALLPKNLITQKSYLFRPPSDQQLLPISNSCPPSSGNKFSCFSDPPMFRSPDALVSLFLSVSSAFISGKFLPFPDFLRVSAVKILFNPGDLWQIMAMLAISIPLPHPVSPHSTPLSPRLVMSLTPPHPTHFSLSLRHQCSVANAPCYFDQCYLWSSVVKAFSFRSFPCLCASVVDFSGPSAYG
jgi:hypothetical protein